MKKLIYILVATFFLLSCGNASEEKQETAKVVERSSAKKVENYRSIGDTVAQQMMDLFGIDGKTVDDIIKTDSLEREIMKFFREADVQKILAESGLTPAEQEVMLSRMKEQGIQEKPTGSDANLQDRTKQKMDIYLQELQEVLANSGSEQKLQDLKDMAEQANSDGKIADFPEQQASPSIENIRKITGINEPSYIEEKLTSYSVYGNAKRQKAMRELTFASKEGGEKILSEYFEVPPNEVHLLGLLPASKKLTSLNVAKELGTDELAQEIMAYLNSGKATPKFKNSIKIYNRNRKLKSEQFLRRASPAKKEFYDLNPGWYGESSETGDIYIDSRNKFVYLPLGVLSFADKVMSHELGNPQGSNTQGALGEPDMAIEKFDEANPRICNLGLRGILTLAFTDNAIADVNGPDLYIFEMGQIEPTNLEISKDGKDWLMVGTIEGGTAKVDIGPFIKPGETFNYVRLTDLATYSTVPGADVDAVAAIGGALRLNLDSAVLFDTGKFKLKEDASEELVKLVAAIKKIPNAKIVVEGHTDNVGNPQSNKTLSENRAQEVSAYLKNILSNQYTFEIKGFGESQPIAPNDTDINKQKNRRVEVLVIPV